MPWCLALIFLLTIGWTAFVAWTLATHGNYASNSLLAIDTAVKSGPATPLILLLAVCAVSLVDSLEGLVVVTKRYLDSKLVEPVRNQLREEGREEGRKEGREEGRKEGTSEERERWQAWNLRRLEAEAKAEAFAESPPGSENTNGKEG